MSEKGSEENGSEKNASFHINTEESMRSDRQVFVQHAFTGKGLEEIDVEGLRSI